ncbi:hypothetical protein RHMOL_Rhmol06G0293900 [Rhododendron molle]|uniref:Uncharacterized protein n=1 Tax=Rhododendron molle TaxID=49168 RepID=A0ACC0NHV2_RHOML|nr:hypothetical protein RHMOL_Rhmol06G0293900 [Rhododendron molle]
MNLDFGRSLDRISKLPDSVLCHILSFLPTKYAVGTSILSTRWQYLWTSVATLDFNDSELFNKRHHTNGIGDAEVDLRFTNFVNTVLLVSDVSCLEKFNLKLESLCYFGIVKAWISTAIKRNVQKLELRYSARHHFDGQIPIQLPHMLFICKTLVDLRLNGNISLNVPDSVWLPSLKILEIKEVIYENGDSAHNLIHGCPALEDLHIYRLYFDKQKVLNISVPTLKRLVLIRLGDDAHLLFSDYDGESQHKLIVNTPKLEYLDIADDVAAEFSLENLSSLLDARINIGPCFSGSISSSNLLKLLHGIAKVKFLRFSSENSDDYVLPTINPLHNLTYLELQDVNEGWNVDLLNVFLENSPNLEVLVLKFRSFIFGFLLASVVCWITLCFEIVLLLVLVAACFVYLLGTGVYLEEEHRRVTMDLDFGRSLDRISKLPDSVLCHILSFLPTKYAVGTSILSARWQYLWISVATLDFNDSELFNKRHRTNGTGEAEVDLRFMNFVNTVLLLSDVSCLEKFNLKLESLCYFGIVKAWISSAIKRNVQMLELHFSAWQQIPIQLPHMLFICQTMVDLRLNGNISLKVPASVWLPSLKILEMEEVIYENGDSAHNLIHGCPALEDLRIFMFYFDKQKVLNISVPTLKRLVLTHRGDDGNLLFSEHKLTVNTPKLEYLEIEDYVAVEFSLENLSSLLDAWPCFSGSISSSNLLKLLHGIANVKFLRPLSLVFTCVKPDQGMNIFCIDNNDDYVLPTINPLHNLTYLELQNVSDGWNKDLLNVFLEYSPNLEVLVLEGSIARLSDRPWSPPPQVPSCLLLNLKEIKYLKFSGDKHEFEVIEYLLKSAEVLKNMIIFVSIQIAGVY